MKSAWVRYGSRCNAKPVGQVRRFGESQTVRPIRACQDRDRECEIGSAAGKAGRAVGLGRLP